MSVAVVWDILLMAAGLKQVHGANTVSAGTVLPVISRFWRAIIVRTRGTVRGIRIISRIESGGKGGKFCDICLTCERWCWRLGFGDAI